MKQDLRNLEAERRALSCLFKGTTEVLAAVSAGLKAEHFTHLASRQIFAAMLRASTDSENVELATVLPHLTNTAGEYVVPLARLLEVESLEPTSLARDKWVRAVILSHKQRALNKHLAEALDLSTVAATQWGDIWAPVAAKLSAAQEVACDKVGRTFGEILTSYQEQRRSPAGVPSTPTGISGVDDACGAPRAGELVVLGGRPGTGKTAFALQLAARAAASVGQVAFFSLEMTGEELAARMVLAAGGRNVRGNHQRERDAAIQTAEQLRQLDGRLHIFDAMQGTGLDEIEARSRLLAASGNLSLVVVDYLQLVTPPSEAKRESREQQVATMSRRLKQLAAQCKCPVVVLAQLNRESAKEERLPRKEDLRESGAIEQDADAVWLLAIDPEWERSQPGELPESVLVRLIQDKRRGGRPNISKNIWFHRPYYSFTESETFVH